MEPRNARLEANPDPARPRLELALRRPRLACGGAPAALVVLVWALLWVWVALGVLAPLSRLGGRPPAAAAELRA